MMITEIKVMLCVQLYACCMCMCVSVFVCSTKTDLVVCRLQLTDSSHEPSRIMQSLNKVSFIQHLDGIREKIEEDEEEKFFYVACCITSSCHVIGCTQRTISCFFARILSENECPFFFTYRVSCKHTSAVHR